MKKGGGCELCGGAARVYCESDRASLCWECDHKVHGANFLVSKHNRSLLCHRCQSPTPWTSSGSRVPPCMSVCLSCLSLAGANAHLQSQPPQQRVQQVESSSPDEDVEQDEEEEGGYASYSDDDEEEEEDDDDENQVVPWTTSSEKPDISVSSTSSEAAADDEDEDEDADEDEDDDADDDGNAKTTLFSSSVLKRKRESAFLHSSHNRNTLPRL